MTTITIKETIPNLPKTEFDSLEDLRLALKELDTIELYQVDEAAISSQSLAKIQRSRSNPRKQLTDFQG